MKNKMRRRSIFVDDELWARIKAVAIREERKPANLIRKALRAWLDHWEALPGS